MKNIQGTKGRKGQRGIARYDPILRRKIGMEYANGDQSLNQLSSRYQIPAQTISRWAIQYSCELAEEPISIPMTEQEQKELAELQKQLVALKKKLEFEQMRNFALETMADLAKTELGIDIRKNFGAKQPKK